MKRSRKIHFEALIQKEKGRHSNLASVRSTGSIRRVCPRVVNPSSGFGGLEGRQKMSVILSVRQFVCPRLPGPGRQSPDFSPQSFSVPP